MRSNVVFSLTVATSLLVAGSAFAVTPDRAGPKARATHVHHAAHQKKVVEPTETGTPAAAPAVQPEPEYFNHALGDDG